MLCCFRDLNLPSEHLLDAGNRQGVLMRQQKSFLLPISFSCIVVADSSALVESI